MSRTHRHPPKKPHYRVRPRLLWLLLGVLALGYGIHRWLAPKPRPPLTTVPHRTQSKPSKKTSPAPAAVLAWHSASWSLPAPAEGLTATVGNGDLLVIGGWSGNSLTTITAEGPHPLALQLTTPVHDAASAVLGQNLYVFGGGTTVALATIQAFSLDGGSVSTPPPLPVPLSDLSAVVHKGTVYLIGGFTGSVFSNAVYAWTPAGGAHKVASLPVGLRYTGAVWYDHQIVIAGGLTVNGASSSVYTVNPGSGHVGSWPSLPVPTMYTTLAIYNHRLYEAGGRTATGLTSNVWQYQTGQSGWTKGPALPTPTYYGAMVSYQNHLWYIGGRTNSALSNTVWMAP